MRTNSVASTQLNGANWTDITSYISELPEVSSRNEYDFGVFTADNISITCFDKDYFKDTFFTGQNYVEVKIEVNLKVGATTTSDNLSVFYGFVDQQNIEYNLNDTINFSAFTIDELASRVPAENYNEQYSVDLFQSGTKDAVLIPNLFGVYIYDCNVSSYACKVGVHKITYSKSGSTLTLAFDGGMSQAITGTGLYTLVNNLQDEKISIVVKINETFTTEEITGKFIITTANSTLPKNFIYGKNLNTFLTGILTTIGINSSDITIDGTLTLPTYNGESRSSAINIPPNDNSIAGNRAAITSNGTNLFIGVGNKVYLRTTSSGAYTSVITLTTDYAIKKLEYNSTAGEIYIIAEDFTAADASLKVLRYNSSYVLQNTETTDSIYNSGNFSPYSIQFVDRRGQGSVEIFGFVYPGAGATAASGYTGHLIYQPWGGGLLSFPIDAYPGAMSVGTGWLLRNTNSLTDTAIVVQHSTTSSSTFTFTSSNNGTWGSSQNGANTSVAIIDSGYLYYYDSANSAFKRILLASGSATTIKSQTNMKVDMVAKANGLIWFCDNANKVLWSVSGADATLQNNFVTAKAESFIYLTDRYYFIDNAGALFQHYTTINLFLLNPDYEGKSLRELLQEVCKAYNLTYTINSYKKAYIYKRGSATGTAVTTGSTLNLNPSEVSDLRKTYKLNSGVELVEVSNSETSQSYGLTGTTSTAAFGVKRLSDARKVDLQNNFIPSAIINDLTYYMYNYYSSDRDNYEVTTPIAKFEYEPFDGLQFYTEYNFLNSEDLQDISDENSDELIAPTDERSGVIIGQNLGTNGETKFEISVAA